MNVFVIEGARKTGGNWQIKGDLIVDATMDVPTDGGGSSSGGGKPKFPKPKIPDLKFDVKWILPPSKPPSEAYNNIKAAAQRMGYETVEHEDFTYPPRR